MATDDNITLTRKFSGVLMAFKDRDTYHKSFEEMEEFLSPILDRVYFVKLPLPVSSPYEAEYYVVSKHNDTIVGSFYINTSLKDLKTFYVLVDNNVNWSNAGYSSQWIVFVEDGDGVSSTVIDEKDMTTENFF